MRIHYWSCSALADRIRGIDKPNSADPADWKEWKIQAKKKHPLRYWFAEEGLDKIQDLVYWPVDFLKSIRYYVNNRWITKTHSLTSKLEKGRWHEFDTRLLHCMFDELVDFVEVEQAWMQVVFADDEEHKKYAVPWWRERPFRIKGWRSAAAGLDYLEWAASLKWNDDWISKDDPDYGKCTPQALVAQETIALYKWWTEVRPARPDPYLASGWTEFCAKKEYWSEERSLEDKEESQRIRDIMDKMEEEYESEDTEMMIRLIRNRGGLWT